MKKTTLALGSLLALGLVTNTFAETTNVYSKNAVGYVNVNLTTTFSMLSVPLVNSSGQPLTITQLFPAPPDSTTLYLYNTGTLMYDEYLYLDGIGWVGAAPGDAGTNTLARGVGFWVYVPTPTNFSLVGEVPGTIYSPTTLVSLASGFSLIAYPYPAARPLSQMKLGQTPNDSDTIYLWTGSGYTEYLYLTGVGWVDAFGPADPVIQPGVGFWYYSAIASSRQVSETKPYNWP